MGRYRGGKVFFGFSARFVVLTKDSVGKGAAPMNSEIFDQYSKSTARILALRLRTIPTTGTCAGFTW
jgi:hypothetical protein